ncbi:MAG: RNA-binding S4 domain-containing protein [Thermoanaerobaculia bacterium]
MSVRIDKWLFVARIYKTRTLAQEACERSRVRVNGTAVKPHRQLALGDRIEAEVAADWTRVVVVRELAERTVAKADAPRLYEDLSPPKPQPDPLARLLRRPPVQRESGAGRPTKRDRRQIDEWNRD